MGALILHNYPAEISEEERIVFMQCLWKFVAEILCLLFHWYLNDIFLISAWFGIRIFSVPRIKSQSVPYCFVLLPPSCLFSFIIQDHFASQNYFFVCRRFPCQGVKAADIGRIASKHVKVTVSEKSPTTPERDRQRTVTVTSFENSMNHVNGKGNDEEDMEIVKESECYRKKG